MKSKSTVRKLKFIHTIFALERDLIVGGQAVMEGVMMRTPSAYAIACRKSDGTMDENFLKAPVKVIMPETSKVKSAGQSAGVVGSIIFALLFNILLFLAAPLLLTNLGFIYAGWADAPAIAAGAGWLEMIKAYVWEIKPHSWIAFNLIDGMVRMFFFVVMIFTMSYLKDIRRVFEYHGAEHKTVFTWEKGLELTPDNATVQRRQHPRCGTSFLMVVMLVAIILFSVIKFDAMWMNLVVRIALMPLVAGLSYEIIRYAAKKESGAIFKLMTMPGLWLQNITTQEPDAGQLEVAIKALDESLKLEPSEIENAPIYQRHLEVVV